MSDLKNKAEAILFSVGKKIDIEEIRKLCRARDIMEIRNALKDLQKDYEVRDSALMIVDEGTSWKLIVRESYLPLVKRIVTDTELPKTVIETLAVVAWKQPILQSEVIRIRTNKAYDHLDELEEMGFLTRQKKGRTKLIKLTDKFFKYFELADERDIADLFKKVRQDKGLPRDKQEMLGQLIVYQEKLPPPTPAVLKEQLGGLEVVDEPEEKNASEMPKVQADNDVPAKEKPKD
ncbi:MAG: SMC-Scp complex subunit ScpB [archaeon]